MKKKGVGVLCRGLFLASAGLLLAFSSQGGQESTVEDAQVTLQKKTPDDRVDLIFSGRFEEAQATGEFVEGLEAGKLLPKHFDEQLDGGDDPFTPGCACRYEQPECGGEIEKRAVDECFPKDGVTLQEKTIPSDCGHYEKKEYNCEQLLGKGARCVLHKLNCCGVMTSSGYCKISVEP